MPRPTKAQVAARENVEIQRAKYAAQESKRAERIQVDQKPVLYVWLVGICVGFAAAATMSFDGISSEAAKIGLSQEWMQYFTFFVVEFLYLMFLLAYLILDSRGEKTVGVQVGMWFFASIGVYANGVDSLNHNNWNLSSIDTWTGLILGIAPPIAIIVIGKQASRVLFAKSIKEA